MILVIRHIQERNEYDGRGNLTSEKGTVWASHGINVNTGGNVMLPSEEWERFKHQCIYMDGEWYLK